MARILIFEDDAEFAELVRHALELDGYGIEITAEGDVALELLTGGQFDLGIIDIFIRQDGRIVPDGGLRLLARLKNRRAATNGSPLKRPPVIAISGEFHNPGIGEIGSYAKSFGADELLSKPFSHDELLNAIKRLIPDG